jgi:hypothetical protein
MYKATVPAVDSGHNVIWVDIDLPSVSAPRQLDESPFVTDLGQLPLLAHPALANGFA